ncbi:MAG: VOC family protein [Chlamydiales bacterium]|nr:VOC family protein [Chlamydiales bacterium]
MQKVVPHLWFDNNAAEAAQFYTSFFPESRIISKTVLQNTPSGDCDILSFKLMGCDFIAISAGPLFQVNPSISFMVGCETKELVDDLWAHLSEGGKALLPLDKYPFSERYGWIQDKYGVSWQLILTKPEGDERPKILPTLLFTGEVYGKAEEAVDFYLSVFKNSKLGNRIHYGPGQEPNKEGTIQFSDFMLGNTWLVAMDGGGDHAFQFNEAISLIVNCKDQSEIDYFWDKLSHVPSSEQCGWVKDKFGISWQIQPANMGDLLAKNPEKTVPAMLQMKKLIIKDLEMAGESL